MAGNVFVGGELGTLLSSHDGPQTLVCVVETGLGNLETVVRALPAKLDQTKSPGVIRRNANLLSDNSAVVPQANQSNVFRVRLAGICVAKPIECATLIRVVAQLCGWGVGKA